MLSLAADGVGSSSVVRSGPPPCSLLRGVPTPRAATPRTMADEDQVSVELSLELQEGLAKSMDYLAQNCLGDDHYNKLQNSLSSKWDRFQSLSAAMKLMEQYGVELSPEEEQQMKSLGEAQMIDALVGKMPQQSKEQFQTFFLQLQNIVSTATQVRQALADGQTDLVEQAVEEAGKTGIAQYILKMALVQVGSEVANLTQQHQAFVKDSQQQMSKSLRGQEDLMAAKKKIGHSSAGAQQVSGGPERENEAGPDEFGIWQWGRIFTCDPARLVGAYQENEAGELNLRGVQRSDRGSRATPHRCPGLSAGQRSQSADEEGRGG